MKFSSALLVHFINTFFVHNLVKVTLLLNQYFLLWFDVFNFSVCWASIVSIVCYWRVYVTSVKLWHQFLETCICSCKVFFYSSSYFTFLFLTVIHRVRFMGDRPWNWTSDLLSSSQLLHFSNDCCSFSFAHRLRFLTNTETTPCVNNHVDFSRICVITPFVTAQAFLSRGVNRHSAEIDFLFRIHVFTTIIHSMTWMCEMLLSIFYL